MKKTFETKYDNTVFFLDAEIKTRGTTVIIDKDIRFDDSNMNNIERNQANANSRRATEAIRHHLSAAMVNVNNSQSVQLRDLIGEDFATELETVANGLGKSLVKPDYAARREARRTAL